MTKPGSDHYHIKYLNSVVKEDISFLPKTVRKLIKKAIEERLSIDPVGLGKPLCYSLKGHRRLRVGDYRIVYRIDHEDRLVTIVVIKHRKDVYEE